MMTKEDMIKDLKRTLDRACDAYYNSSIPIMSDEEFDQACITYRKLSGENYNTMTASRNNKDDSKKTNGKKLVDTKHTFENLLCTIDNKFQNLDDLNEWIDSLYDNLNLNKSDELELLVSEKYDGNSICIEYEDGKCKLAVTRGEDGQGADLTEIFKDEKLLKKPKWYCGIKYEVMLSYPNFDRLNKVREANKEDTYANPRNTVAGILSRLDAPKFREYLTLVPLSMRIKDKEIDRYKELDYIEKLQSKGDIEFNGEILSGTNGELKDYIREIYERYTNSRENLNYMIDGLVIEVMDETYKKQLGHFAAGSPKWQAAVKFPYMEKATTVEDIVFEASPNGTGKITPSVIIKPVYFNGAEMRKISLANYKRFNELRLGKGSRVLIEYRNDVLSYCSPLDDPINDTIDPIPFTDHCPACKSTKIRINENETFAYCDNPNCGMKRIGKINHYTNMVGIKGIETTTLEKIVNAGLLNTSADLYRLNYRSLSRVDGLGSKSAENIVDAIHQNTPNDYDILAGLGIDNLGKDCAKNILSEVSFDKLCDKSYVESNQFKDTLTGIEGIGPVMTERIPKELAANNALLNDLLATVKFKTVKRAKADNQLIFVTTGDPDHRYFDNRDALRKYIEDKGHKLTSAVSKKTNYLITETPNSGTTKNKKAIECGTKIITCEQLIDMLG